MVTVSVNDMLDLADDIMRLGRVRHMPVLDGEALVGVVSSRDLLAASLTKSLEFEPSHRRAFLRAVSVREAMTPDPLTARPDTVLEEAARTLCGGKIGCLPVTLEDGTLVGIITETDLVRAAYLEPIDGGPVIEEAAERLKEELRRLEEIRGELRVQLHLGRAEARELWHELEHKWRDAERKVVEITREAERPLSEARDVAEHLLEELREGYRRIRKSLAS